VYARVIHERMLYVYFVCNLTGALIRYQKTSVKTRALCAYCANTLKYDRRNIRAS